MVEVEVISTSSVTPATKTEENHSVSRIELSPWDVRFLLVQVNQRGLLFHKLESREAHEVFGNNLIDHLKLSLSHTLDFFLPLAGRIGTTKNDDDTTSFFIDCNNEGAQFTHAIVHGLKVSDILEAVYVPRIVHSFFQLNGVSNYEGISKPLLAVQVTQLEDGFFIGCTMNHCVADGTCFWQFFNSWSQISRGFSSVTKPPVFTRWFPDDDDNIYPIHIPLQDEQILDKHIPPPLLERVFHFTKGHIARLKARANSEIGTQRISSLQAVVAHLWRTITRCRTPDANQTVTLRLFVCTRKRLQPSLPDGYFGNAVQMSPVTATARQLLENGLGWAAREINRIVALQTNETMSKLYRDLVKTPVVVTHSKIQKNTLVISSSPRFNVYGNDFGWGKPLAVRSGRGNRYDGIVTVFPGLEEGSMDFEACLSPETLYVLGNDAEFMEAISI